MPPRKPSKPKTQKRQADTAASRESLLRQVRQLRRELGQSRQQLADRDAQYAEAVDTLEAIRSGAVDAVVVGSAEGERVYTLAGAERSYRLLVETVNAGALTLGPDGTVLYANTQAAKLLGVALERLLGARLEPWIAPEDLPAFARLLGEAAGGEAAGDLHLLSDFTRRLPVHLALRRLEAPEVQAICVVMTDLTERQQAEDALRAANEALEARVRERTAALQESEQQERARRAELQALIEAIPSPVWMSRDAKCDVISGNRAAAELLGVPAGTENLSGSALGSLRGVEVRRNGEPLAPEQLTMQRAARICRPVRDDELEIVRRDGTVRWIVEHAVPLLDEQGRVRGCVGVSMDITERKRAEAALAAQRRLFDAVLTQVPDGIVIRDSAGRLVFANPAAKRDARVPLEGTAMDEALQVWGETRDAAGNVIPVAEWPITAALRGESRCAEWHRTRQDGQTYVALNCATPLRDNAGAILGAVAVTSDITGRKQAEDALAAQRRLLEAILEQAADGIVVRDASGRVTLANAMARRWAYRPPEGTLLEEAPAVWGGTTTREGDPLPVDEWPMRRALQGVTVTGVEFHRVTPDGRRLVLTTSAAPLRGPQGALLGAVAILTDITERMGMEGRLRQAAADKDALLREVHHRVKNNLQILCDLLYLQAEGTGSPEAEDALRDAYTRIYAIARLHEQLYQAMTGGAIRLTDYFGRLITGFASIYAGAPVRLEAPTDQVIFLDVDRAIHVGLLVNELVTNAMKHAFRAGQPGTVTIGIQAVQDQLELQVRDTGVGLPAGLDLSQAKTLGLRIVHILARRLDATVRIENRSGACFTVRLPLRADAPVEPKG